MPRPTDPTFTITFETRTHIGGLNERHGMSRPLRLFLAAIRVHSSPFAVKRVHPWFRFRACCGRSSRHSRAPSPSVSIGVHPWLELRRQETGNRIQKAEFSRVLRLFAASISVYSVPVLRSGSATEDGCSVVDDLPPLRGLNLQ